jgi:hypothetical protein
MPVRARGDDLRAVLDFVTPDPCSLDVRLRAERRAAFDAGVFDVHGCTSKDRDDQKATLNFTHHDNECFPIESGSAFESKLPMLLRKGDRGAADGMLDVMCLNVRVLRLILRMLRQNDATVPCGVLDSRQVRRTHRDDVTS